MFTVRRKSGNMIMMIRNLMIVTITIRIISLIFLILLLLLLLFNRVSTIIPNLTTTTRTIMFNTTYHRDDNINTTTIIYDDNYNYKTTTATATTTILFNINKNNIVHDSTILKQEQEQQVPKIFLEQDEMEERFIRYINCFQSEYYHTNNSNHHHYHLHHRLIPYYQDIIDSIRLQQHQQQNEQNHPQQQLTTTTNASNYYSKSSLLSSSSSTTHQQQNQQEQNQKQRSHYTQYQHHYRYLKSLVHPKLGSTLTNLINTYNNQNNNQNSIVVADDASNQDNSNSEEVGIRFSNTTTNQNHDDSSKGTTTTPINTNDFSDGITILNNGEIIIVDVVIDINGLFNRIITTSTKTTNTNTYTYDDNINNNTSSNSNHTNTKMSLSTILQLHGFNTNIMNIDIDNTNNNNDDTIPIITIINCYMYVCSMYIPINQLNNFIELEYIQSIRPVMVQTNAGSVLSEGDVALYTNLVRDQYKVDGTGIVIGILSDSYDCKNGATTDIVNGNLPSNPDNRIILIDLNTTECNAGMGIDEGRAMMQIIHDIAPNAKLVFRTAKRGMADFAMGIMELFNYGCNIIVDDIKYIEEPFFEDGIIAKAIDTVVSNGILYFTAVGNEGMNAWDASSGFIRSKIIDPEYGEYHEFDVDFLGNKTLVQFIALPNIDHNFIFVFQWNEPYQNVRNDIDIYFEAYGKVIGSGIDVNNQVGGNPIEIVMINPKTINLAGKTIFIGMFIQLFAGSPDGKVPDYMKVVAYNSVVDGQIIFEYAKNGASTAVGHSNSALGASVGAASYLQTPPYGVSPPIIEPYSSLGGTPIYYDQSGQRVVSRQIRQQPRFVGPDNTLISFSLFSNMNDNRLKGTSAAVAHVAAVAALFLQGIKRDSSRTLLPEDIFKLIETTAIDMDSASTFNVFDNGVDFNTGYGFVNTIALFETANIPIPPCNFRCRFRCFLARMLFGNDNQC